MGIAQVEAKFRYLAQYLPGLDTAMEHLVTAFGDVNRAVAL